MTAMTPEQINALDLSQLRVAVAEVMGWIHFGCTGCAQSPCMCNQYLGPDDEGPCSTPDFETDHNAAITLVDKLAEDGWRCELNNGLDKTWECTFSRPARPESKDENCTPTRNGVIELHYAPGNTAPIAICRAFLLTQRKTP